MDSRLLEIGMEHYYQRVKGWFNWPEMYERAVRLAPDPAVFVEIGCHLGKSTSCLGVEALNSGKRITIFAIDLWDINNKIACDVKDFWKTVGPINSFKGTKTFIKPMRGDSTVLHEQFQGESVDFVWVDGNHRYPYAIADIRNWWPKLKQGGWMGGDDLIHGGVRQAVEEFFGPECSAGSNKEGNWIGNQSPTVYTGKGNDIRPTGGGWVWWARSKRDDLWVPPGLQVETDDA